MDIEKYRDRLLALERTLSARASRLQDAATQQTPDVPGDTGDASLADAGESESFTEAELATTNLQEVGDALARIEAGTYGQCEADGQPIPPARLDVVPWARFCVKHQAGREEAVGLRTPTL